MTFLRKMIFSTKSVKFFDTFAEQDNSFFSFSLLFLPIFRFFPSIFFSSAYQKVYVPVDISSRIHGYFITYPRLREFFALYSRFIGCTLSFFLIWVGINSFVPICLAKLLTRASTIARKNRKNAFLSENCKVSLHFSRYILEKTHKKRHFVPYVL